MGCGSSRSSSSTDGGDSAHAPSDVVTTVTLQKLDHATDKPTTSTTAGQQEVQQTQVHSQAKEMNLTEAQSSQTNCVLTILHFNDVYNIEPREVEPVGGAARLASKLNSYKYLNPLIAFSGDCLNPSAMSSVTRGKQMIPILNALNVHIAVYGNHDFDFGVDDLLSFNEETNFPWLMSNVVDKETNRPLGDGEIKHIIEWGGKKIGFIGLVEEDWLATLATVDPEELNYFDFVIMGTKLAKELRDEGAEFVIALTHMRVPNDCRLAQEASGIDLILGGHDHDYEVKQLNGVHMIKSGTDFRELSEITLNFSDENNYTVDIRKVEINSDIAEDAEVKQIVDQYLDIMKDQLEEILGHVEVELDGRFASVRTRETNLGNFVVDIMRNVTEADVALLNSGTLRSDALHPPGEFKMKDLVSILPMADSLVLLEVTGKQILDALENGVSQWPKHEGRFPQVSGMRFSFDPKKEQGSRVMQESVQICGRNLQKDKVYTLCTKSYLANGKDGYKVFTQAKVITNEEEGPVLPTIVQNHFRSISIVKGNKKSRSSHRQSLVMRSGDQPSTTQELERQMNTKTDKSATGIRRRRRSVSSRVLLVVEKEHVKIAPQVEGRITIIGEGPAPRARGPSVCDPIEEEILVRRQEFKRENQPKDELTEWPERTECDDINDKKVSEDKNKENTVELGENASAENDERRNEQEQERVRENSLELQAALASNDTEQENNKHESCTQAEVEKDAPEPEHTDLATEDDYWDLWEAVKVDDIDVVRNLREKKNIRLTRMQDNKTILHLGAERNAAKVVEFLIVEGKVNPNVLDEILQGVPLHGAAEYGSVDAARILLEHGAEVNTQDLIGNSALHIACANEQVDMKNLLVHKGADTTLVNTDGETPAV